MKQSFIKGTLTLLIGSFISRILGFAYRVYIIRLVGAEGVGLYEMIFPIMTLILVLTTAGIPVAVARLVAHYQSQGDSFRVATTLRLSFVVLAITGTLIPAVLMHIGPRILGTVTNDPRAYWAFMTMVPAIFFVSIASVIRGYYQGIGFMFPLALSQISEQLSRIAVGCTIVPFLLPYGVEFAAAGLALAMVIGEAMGLSALLAQYGRLKPSIPVSPPSEKLKNAQILGQLFSYAAPVTLSRITSSLTLSIKAIIIPRRLTASGLSLYEATATYGAFSGIAMSLLSFPAIITVSLANVLLPSITTAITRQNFVQLNLRVNQGVKFTVLVALPFCIWFYLFSEELTVGFFKNQIASIPLKFLAPACIFIYLQQTTSGILYGLGRMKSLLLNSILGNSLSLILTYLLTGLPYLGIKGTALSTLFGAALISILNLKTVNKQAEITIRTRTWFGGTLIATFGMGFLAYFLKAKLALIPALTLSGFFYLLNLLLFRVLTKEDFSAKEF